MVAKTKIQVKSACPETVRGLVHFRPRTADSPDSNPGFDHFRRRTVDSYHGFVRAFFFFRVGPFLPETVMSPMTPTTSSTIFLSRAGPLIVRRTPHPQRMGIFQKYEESAGHVILQVVVFSQNVRNPPDMYVILQVVVFSQSMRSPP